MNKDDCIQFIKRNATQICIVIFGILILIQQQYMIEQQQKFINEVQTIEVNTSYDSPLEVEVINKPLEVREY